MAVFQGTELNPALKYLFESRINTAILATNDKEHHPNTAPFNCIVAPNAKHLRIAICKDHQTYANIIENGNVALAVINEGDIAACIKGTAQIVHNHMDFDLNMAVIDIEISEIHRNNSTIFLVTQGIRTQYKSEQSLVDFRKLRYELTHL
jgi:uncharacterized pyridoxamine 5'-phosphate oxidase family protein